MALMIPTPEGGDVVVRIGNAAEDTTSGSIEFANVISPGITVSRLNDTSVLEMQ
jgi:hypothetical protein